MNRRTSNLDGSRGCSHKRKRNNWRSGLPTNNYWTGTEDPDNPGNSWNVNDNGGNVNAGNNNQTNDNRVVCVP